MAGSFNHMVDDDGKLTFGFLENGGDHIEALEECWNIIVELTGGDRSKVDNARRAMVGPGKLYPGTYLPREGGPDLIVHTRYQEIPGAPRSFKKS